ncbi:HDOD domain-containing protein [bacterium]|nr:HDOD domain-containing protein [bacterium]
MASKTNELQEILQTLGTLQSRVQELTAETGDVGNVPTDEADTDQPESPAVEPVRGPVVAPLRHARGDVGRDGMALLRAGIAELTTISEFKNFPKYFVGLAGKTGLRMLLLKKWTTGLQVFLEENIKVPPEARRKRPDGRAPIPTSRADIFEATANEATVYAGPVPVKHFPLDLTLMLGRGSRDRQIVIVPLPSQGHWNTFIYLDADKAAEKSLAIAEILAQFALARMQLLAKGVQTRQGRVAGILKSELHRRQKSQALRAERGPQPPALAADPPGSDDPLAIGGPVSPGPAPAASNAPEIDPFVVQPATAENADEGAPAPRPRRKLKLAPAGTSAPETDTGRTAMPDPKTADALPEAPAWADGDGATVRLTPEIVLSHSGELPALPRAACHIMAVIEDPRTTATKLESALAMDQALTAKVLRIANSPFYGAVREIKTVSEAIVRLGFVAIRNWTLVTAARSVFLAPGAGMLYQKIWRQSVMSAMAGQLVAQVVGRADPEAVFIGGLMQNIGQLVLARSHPELFQEILTESATTGRPYHEVEKETLGFDHGALGALLIREWNLSQDLEDAVRWHHDFAADEARNAQVAAMIALGEEIALTTSGEDADPSATDAPAEPEELSPVARFLGVTSVRVRELREKAKELQIDPHFFT